ncbi:hypothetical protein BVI2075_320195 [Burkholderia vietnamiensis]|nr:hypothetical protein BVI2075_320195 [Burkholderia vietnamiensis]
MLIPEIESLENSPDSPIISINFDLSWQINTGGTGNPVTPLNSALVF